MSKKMIVLGVLIVAVVGYAFGRYLQPPDIKIKTVIQEKEVIVERKNIVTVVKEVVRPDGTKETETRTEDKSETTGKKDSSTNNNYESISSKPQWRVQGMIGLNAQAKNDYGLAVERRIIGPIFVGAYGNTQKSMGLSVSIEF